MIINNCKFLKIKSSELKEFVCKSNWNEKKAYFQPEYNSNLIRFKPYLPFSNIIVEQLNQFWITFKQRENLSIDKFDKSKLKTYINTIPNLFENTTIYDVINTTFIKESSRQIDLLDLYINDFIIFNTDVRSQDEIILIKQLLINRIEELQIPNINNFKL